MKILFMYVICIGLSLCLTCNGVSQTPSVQHQLIVENDSTLLGDSVLIKEVEVSAPIYIHSNKFWPGALNQLTTDDISSGNSYQLSEQLNTLPGVFMQQGTMSTNRITIRGVGSRTPYESNRIKAYWGGMPLSDGDGVTAIEDISLQDISNLRVLKGPSSALFGAGMGGVILLDPWLHFTQEPFVRYKGEVGSFGTISNQLKLNHQFCDRGRWSLGLSHLNSQGFRENSKYRRYNLTIKGKQQFGRHYFDLLYNFRFLNGQIPSSLDSATFINHPEKAATSWKAIGGYEESERHLLNVGLKTNLASVLTNSFNVFAGLCAMDELRPFNRLKESQRAIGLREKLSYRDGSFRSELGFEWMSESKHISTYGVKASNTGDLLNDNDVTKSYVNIFALVEWRFLDKWIWQVSANLNRTYYTSIAGNDEALGHKYDWVFSPRFGFNYELNHLIHFYGSVGHGFSAPSLQEAQLPDLSFNPEIQMEEGVNYEFGVRFQSLGRRTYADVVFYWMNLDNLLVTKRESDEVFYGVNAGETKHNGLELILNQQFLSARSDRSLDLSFSFFTSNNTFGSFVDDGYNYEGNYLPGIPEFTMAFNAHVSLKHYHLYVNYKGIGDQYLTDDNSKRYEAYHKLGARLSRNVHVNKVFASVYVGADNILDAHYASMVLINAPSFGGRSPRYYYPGLPFNVYGGMTLNF